MGGVLIDWNPRYLFRQFFHDDPVATDRFLTEIGFSAWNLEMDRGHPLAQSITELSRQFPQYTRLIKAYDECWEETIGGPIQPTVDILYLLKQRGYALYGLSNWSPDTFRRVRHKYAFFDCFEIIVLSGEAKLIKPDPRLFRIFLERIGRRAEECLLIDDAEANIVAAKVLGFQTIHFESADQLREELCRRGLLTQNDDVTPTAGAARPSAFSHDV